MHVVIDCCCICCVCAPNHGQGSRWPLCVTGEDQHMTSEDVPSTEGPSETDYPLTSSLNSDTEGNVRTTRLGPGRAETQPRAL